MSTKKLPPRLGELRLVGNVYQRRPGLEPEPKNDRLREFRDRRMIYGGSNDDLLVSALEDEIQR